MAATTDNYSKQATKRSLYLLEVNVTGTVWSALGEAGRYLTERRERPVGLVEVKLPDEVAPQVRHVSHTTK